ncbi:MAG: propionyl-CoA synthetase, partial [Pseudomonadales bacterium]|nr:propionyl-CoA synthetase [Pseudomonadales bacterium]
MTSYKEEYQRSQQHPERFWAEKADDIQWYKKPQTILGKDENGVDRWFVDGELNTCYLAVDYHVEQGKGEQTAIIYDSPVTKSKARITYQQLL